MDALLILGDESCRGGGAASDVRIVEVAGEAEFYLRNFDRQRVMVNIVSDNCLAMAG